MRLVLAATALTALVFVGGASAGLTRGVLDPTFGDAGQAIDHFSADPGGNGARLLQAPDGTLYAVSPAIDGIRLDWVKPDGTMIERRTLGFPQFGAFSLDDATLAPDGDIIVVGNGFDTIGDPKGGIVWDFTPALFPRLTFGTNGVAIIAPDGDIDAHVVGVEPNGEIAVAGDSRRIYNDQVFELSATGSIVRDFARDSFSGEFTAAAVAPNGDVVFGSITGDSTLHLWRQPPGWAAPITPAPVQIPLFAGSAVIAELDHIAFSADGSIVVGGLATLPLGNFNPSLAPGSWVMRLTPQGEIDPSFGQNGATNHLWSLGDLSGSALAVEADGSVVSAVDTEATFGTTTRVYSVGVSRTLPDGGDDLSFGSTVPFPITQGTSAFLGTTDMVVEPNGRLVTLSYFSDGTTGGVVLTGFASGPADRDLAFGPAPAVALEQVAGGTAANYTPPAAIDDDNDASVTCTPAVGTLLSPGTRTVTCTAVDPEDLASPVSVSFPLTISDTTPPWVIVPAPIVQEALAPREELPYSVSARDTVDGPLTPTCSPSSDVFPVGTTTVTCTARDWAGNVGTASFTVTLRDTTPPSITTPSSPVVVEATGPTGAAAPFAVTAFDRISGTVAVTCDPASGTTLSLGSHTVTCSASDAAGNVGHAMFEVDVHDTTPPVLQVPSAITVDATSPAGAAVTFAATAQDLVDGSVPATCTPASGTTIAIGTTTVQCTATDSHGNQATGAFDVIVAGPAQQLADVAAFVATNALGPGTSLGTKLQAARDAVAANDAPTACGALRAFGNEAKAQSGKKLTQDEAQRLSGDAGRIRTVLGC